MCSIETHFLSYKPNRPLDAMYIFENKKRWMRMLHPALFLLACVGPRFALVCAELHRF